MEKTRTFVRSSKEQLLVTEREKKVLLAIDGLRKVNKMLVSKKFHRIHRRRWQTIGSTLPEEKNLTYLLKVRDHHDFSIDHWLEIFIPQSHAEMPLFYF